MLSILLTITTMITYYLLSNRYNNNNNQIHNLRSYDIEDDNYIHVTQINNFDNTNTHNAFEFNVITSNWKWKHLEVNNSLRNLEETNRHIALECAICMDEMIYIESNNISLSEDNNVMPFDLHLFNSSHKVYCITDSIEHLDDDNNNIDNGNNGLHRFKQEVPINIPRNKAEADHSWAVILQCGHVYHADCIFKWLKSTCVTCPTCRASIVTSRPSNMEM
jgi:hypothetical protein